MNMVGSCPKCGAPIYSSNMWMGITPPPAQYTCLCRMGYAPAQQGPVYETRESTTGCVPIAQLTEADVRRIVRDELGKSVSESK